MTKTTFPNESPVFPFHYLTYDTVCINFDHVLLFLDNFVSSCTTFIFLLTIALL